ncbi:MAG TPA: ADP-ribosylglycohydrolase family protein [Mobilitalea sp.]|nr:ADP-ribosylglycohydrolase family protein [Mobilitalea sp.]
MRNLLKALKDGLLGYIIGDILGVPAEFLTREELDLNPVTGFRAYGTHNQPAFTWSDDTSVTLATFAAISKTLENYRDTDILIKNPKILAKAIMEEMVLWFKEGKYSCHGTAFDIGFTTKSAIECYIKEKNTDTCGLGHEEDNGNGALMRMFPIALFLAFCNKPNYVLTGASAREFYFISYICGITHKHERSILACVIYIQLILWLLRGASLKTAMKMAYFGGCHVYNENAKKYHMAGNETRAYDYRIFMDIIYERYSRDKIRSTGYVVDTLEAVFWCLAITSSYKDCVLEAVNLGGDTDTIAAIAGSAAGIYYGLKKNTGVN